MCVWPDTRVCVPCHVCVCAVWDTCVCALSRVCALSCVCALGVTRVCVPCHVGVCVYVWPDTLVYVACCVSVCPGCDTCVCGLSRVSGLTRVCVWPVVCVPWV